MNARDFIGRFDWILIDLGGPDTDRSKLDGAREDIIALFQEANILPSVNASSQWHKFDKDDESTWPTQNLGTYWVFSPDASYRVVFDRVWESRAEEWGHYSHWMPIEVPEPPTEVAS